MGWIPGPNEVHYRLYRSWGVIRVICVQDFDYVDYDAKLFVGDTCYKTEAEAEKAAKGLK